MRVLDLFSGIGGMSLGLARAGFTTVAFCECKPYCRAILRQTWPHVPIYNDVRELTKQCLEADGIVCDIIAGGFPCQDVSIAGSKRGLAGERSGLWKEFARIVGEVRPRYVLVENTTGLLVWGMDRILGELSALGYDAEWHAIPASAIGAPHRRDRIWIVAYPNAAGRQRERQQEWSGEFCACGYQSHRLGAGGSGTGPAVGADTDSAGRDAGGSAQAAQVRGGDRRGTEPDGLGGDIPDTDVAGRAQQWRGVPIHEALAFAQCADWWEAEPPVGRVADGIPGRVDRLEALGNAVVPQVVEVIGRAIMEHERISQAG